MRVKINKKIYDTKENSIFVYTLTETEAVRRDLFKTFKGDLFIYEYCRYQNDRVLESIKVFNKVEDLCKEISKYQANFGVESALSCHFNVKNKRAILSYLSKKLI